MHLLMNNNLPQDHSLGLDVTSDHLSNLEDIPQTAPVHPKCIWYFQVFIHVRKSVFYVELSLDIKEILH